MKTKTPLGVSEALGRFVATSGLVNSDRTLLEDPAMGASLGPGQAPTRHSSVRCALTQHRSTRSVFCCKAVWETATRNMSLNRRDSVAGWTFVRNRQLTSAEEGSRATRKYLQGARERNGFQRLFSYAGFSDRLKVSAKDRNQQRRTTGM